MNTSVTRFRSVLLCAVIMFTALTAHGQTGVDDTDDPLNFRERGTKVLIGPRIGLNRNYHSGGFATIVGANCPVFDAGSGWGFLGGLTAEIISATGTWSLIPAVTFESRPGNFTQRLPDVDVLLTDSPGAAVRQTISANSDIKYSLLSVEVMYKQEIWQPGKSFRLAVGAGPVGSYVLGGKVKQYYDLEEPLNARFLPEAVPTGGHLEMNDRRMVLADSEEIPGQSAIRFSLKGGLMGEIGLFNNQIMMYPGVFYDFGLTNVTDQENWSLNSMLFQVDFRRAF